MTQEKQIEENVQNALPYFNKETTKALEYTNKVYKRIGILTYGILTLFIILCVLSFLNKLDVDYIFLALCISFASLFWFIIASDTEIYNKIDIVQEWVKNELNPGKMHSAITPNRIDLLEERIKKLEKKINK